MNSKFKYVVLTFSFFVNPLMIPLEIGCIVAILSGKKIIFINISIGEKIFSEKLYTFIENKIIEKII